MPQPLPLQLQTCAYPFAMHSHLFAPLRSKALTHEPLNHVTFPTKADGNAWNFWVHKPEEFLRKARSLPSKSS